MTASLSDTSAEVAELQRQRLAAMTVNERAQLLVALCEGVTQAAEAGIRHEFPNATEAEVRSELLLRRYGADFVQSLPQELR